MTAQRDQIRSRLNHIFRDVFGDDSIEIFDSMSASDIDDWDSLMHVTLVLSVESVFHVRLKASEVAKLENVGAMITLLEEKSPTADRT